MGKGSDASDMHQILPYYILCYILWSTGWSPMIPAGEVIFNQELVKMFADERVQGRNTAGPGHGTSGNEFWERYRFRALDRTEGRVQGRNTGRGHSGDRQASPCTLGKEFLERYWSRALGGTERYRKWSKKDRATGWLYTCSMESGQNTSEHELRANKRGWKRPIL